MCKHRLIYANIKCPANIFIASEIKLAKSEESKRQVQYPITNNKQADKDRVL